MPYLRGRWITQNCSPVSRLNSNPSPLATWLGSGQPNSARWARYQVSISGQVKLLRSYSEAKAEVVRPSKPCGVPSSAPSLDRTLVPGGRAANSGSARRAACVVGRYAISGRSMPARHARGSSCYVITAGGAEVLRRPDARAGRRIRPRRASYEQMTMCGVGCESTYGAVSVETRWPTRKSLL
jgi:hypothetical protein